MDKSAIHEDGTYKANPDKQKEEGILVVHITYDNVFFYILGIVVGLAFFGLFRGD